MPKSRIVNAVVMFVNEYPGHGRINEIAVFSISAKRLAGSMAMRPIQPRPMRRGRHWPTMALTLGSAPCIAYSANRLVHCEAANTLRPYRAKIVSPRIGWALVYSVILTGVGSQKIKVFV